MKNIASSITGLTGLLVLLLVAQQARAQQDFWGPTNGPWGSFINALAIDNNTGDFFLVGYDGVYRSVDKGGTWMFAGLPRQYNHAVVVDGNGSIFVGGEEGMFRSNDQGSTWTKVHAAGSIDPHSIIIDRNDHIYFADFFQNVYRSTDNGNTWTDIGLAGVRALAIDSHNRILAATEHGLWRFDGNTWTAEWPANKDLGSVAVNSMGHIFTVQVFGSVFRSTDDGQTWTDIGLTDADVRVLGISSTDEIFAGCFEGGIFRSNDNGDHWANTGLNDEQFVNDLTFDTDGRLFASTSSGVYWSADNGNNWTEANTGLRDTYIGALGVDPAGNVFAGEHYKGLFQTTDNGNSWTNVGRKNFHFIKAMAFNDSGHVFVGTAFFGIFRSADHGSTWDTLSGPGYGPETVEDILVTSDGTLFVASGLSWFPVGGGVFRSSDNGDTWTPIDAIGNIVSALAVNSSGHIFAGSNWDDNKGLYTSKDNGDNWESLGLNYPIKALVINGNDHIFAGTAGNGIFRSTDNGGTWEAVNTGLVADTVLDLEVNVIGILFAATPQGVFRSADDGETWGLVNTGLANLAVTDLAVTKDGFLFAGTDGSGVFRSKMSTTGLKAPASMTVSKLGQNTPNPCANTTRINYEVARQGPVTISVYDATGQLVKTLANGLRFPGSNALNVDTSGLENGVYFYVMLTGSGEVLSRKMVVLR